MNILHQDFESNDESDEDYEPEEVSVQNGDDSQKKKGKQNSNKQIDEIWNEMKEQIKQQQLKYNENTKNITNIQDQSLESLAEEAINIVRKLKDKDKKQEKIVKFAGQQYKVVTSETLGYEKTTEIEIVKSDGISTNTNNNTALTHSNKKKIGQWEYLKSVLRHLDNKAKNVNSVSKSKLDWGKFTAKAGIDKELEKNRKNGFLEKRKFLKNTNLKEIEALKLSKKHKHE